MDEVAVERRIAASPEQVYALVSDLPRMGEWSNENTGGRWVRGATGPAVGARFVGTNRNDRLRWKTLATVTAAEPGLRFAFSVTAMGLKVADWAYEIAPDDDGCIVTETWRDRRDPISKRISSFISGVPDRAAFAKEGMAQTLEALARSVEQA